MFLKVYIRVSHILKIHSQISFFFKKIDGRSRVETNERFVFFILNSSCRLWEFFNSRQFYTFFHNKMGKIQHFTKRSKKTEKKSLTCLDTIATFSVPWQKN